MRLKTLAFMLCCVILPSFLFFGCQNGEAKQNDDISIDTEYFDNGLIAVDLIINYPLRYRGQDSVTVNVFPRLYVDKDDKSVFELISVKVNGSNALNRLTDLSECAIKIDISEYKRGKSVKLYFKYIVNLGSFKEGSSVKDYSVNIVDFVLLPAPYKDDTFIVLDENNSDVCRFTADLADYKIKLTVPSVYTVAASGFTSSIDVANEKTAYYFDMKNVLSFAFSLSKSYNVLFQKWGNRSINYYYRDIDDAFAVVELIKKCLYCFENIFGKYPYESFSICRIKEGDGLHPFSGIGFVPNNHTDEEGYFEIVRSAAYQWWGSTVLAKDTKSLKLLNGLCDFSAYLFFDYFKGYGVNVERIVAYVEKDSVSIKFFNDMVAFFKKNGNNITESNLRRLVKECSYKDVSSSALLKILS